VQIQREKGVARPHAPHAEWWRSLRRAVATMRSYPSGNALTERALGDLAERSRIALPACFAIGNGVVREAGNGAAIDLDEGLAALVVTLYRDGVRELRFGEGFARPEVDRFVAALALGHDAQDLAEDSVTRLWEAELASVAVVALDPYLDREIPGDVLEGKQRPTGEFEGVPPDLTLSVGAPPDEAFRLSETDRANLRSELEQAKQSAPWASFTATLIETLHSPVAERRGEELVGVLESALFRLLQAREPRCAAQLLEVAQGETRLPRGLVVAALGRVTHEERLEPLRQLVEREPERHADVRGFLDRLGAAVVPTLRQFLPCAVTEGARRFWAEALGAAGPPGADALVEIAAKGDASSCVAAARVLAATGDARFAPVLWRAFERSEGVARRELLRAANGLAPDGARVLAVAVGDPDPECRLVALGALVGRRDASVEGRLLERLGARDAAHLSEGEKDALYRALGSVGDARAVDYLAKRLAGGGWLAGGDRAEQVRAARALARLRSPRAHEILRARAAAGGALAEVCRRVLCEAGITP
jgi:hypothetical protein